MAKEAFKWIDRRGGPFDAPGPLGFVAREAQRIHGEHSPQHRKLTALRQVRGLTAMSEPLRELAAAVQRFDEGMRGMPPLEE